MDTIPAFGVLDIDPTRRNGTRLLQVRPITTRLTITSASHKNAWAKRIRPWTLSERQSTPATENTLSEYAYAMMLCRNGKAKDAELTVRYALELSQFRPSGEVVL